MSENCKTCPSAAGCSIPPDQCGQETKPGALVGAFNNIRNVLVVMSGKGGVGKSSVTGLLAMALARQGKQVGILDADITGPSQPKAFGIKGQIKASEYGMEPPVSGLGIKVMSINFFLPNEDDPVIWRGPMLAGAVKQFWSDVDWRDLDYLIVDLPPGTGDIPLTVMQSLPVNGIIIVSSPQDLAFMVVKKTIKMAQKLQLPIVGLIENMSYAVCPHCNEKLEIFGKSQGLKVAQETGIPYLGGLPWDAKFNGLVDEGDIEEYQSEEMEEIARQIELQVP